MSRFGAIITRAASGAGMALGGVAMHRLRSIITIAGVMIAVASIVSLVGIGEGARLAIVRQFESLGTNLVKIESHHWRAELRAEDAHLLEERVPTISIAMPVVRADTQIKWRRRAQDQSIIGVSEDFPILRQHRTVAGRFFSHLHVELHRLIYCNQRELSTTIPARSRFWLQPVQKVSGAGEEGNARSREGMGLEL